MIAFLLTSFLSLVNTACEYRNNTDRIVSGYFTKFKDPSKSSNDAKIEFIIIKSFITAHNLFYITFKYYKNNNVTVNLVKKSKEDIEYKFCSYITCNHKRNTNITKIVFIKDIKDGDKLKICTRFKK